MRPPTSPRTTSGTGTTSPGPRCLRRRSARRSSDRPARRRSARRSPGRRRSRRRRAQRIRRHGRERSFRAARHRLGAFVIRPSIEIGVSATDNGGGTARKKSAVGLAVAPEINIRSENDRYEFEADRARRGGLLRRRGSSTTRTIDAEAKLRYASDQPHGGQRRGRLFAIPGRLQRSRYADRGVGAARRRRPRRVAWRRADDGAGHRAASPALPTDRSTRTCRSSAAAPLRARSSTTPSSACASAPAIATSASLRPFVEAAVARREFDQQRDDSGFARSSVWGELLGGIVIDRGDKLSGEVSLGYRREDLEDDRLEDLNVFVANAAVLWSPHRLTDVKLDFTTDVQPTSTPGRFGVVLYSGTLTLRATI